MGIFITIYFITKEVNLIILTINYIKNIISDNFSIIYRNLQICFNKNIKFLLDKLLVK